MQINFLDSFEQTVCDNADKIAVIHGETGISFHELKCKAQKLGTLLIEMVRGVTNRPIAVLLPKEIDAVIADIGILYSSNPFMNLDVKTPKERIRNILELIRPVCVVTAREYTDCLDGIADLEACIPILNIKTLDWENMPTDEQLLLKRRSERIDLDPFCLINTSGSTGTPKSVVLSHRSFFDFMEAASEHFGFDGSETIGSLSPIVFDIFDFELCMMMVHGSQIVLLNASLASFPIRLLEALAVCRVSFIFWVPSVMVNIANLRLLEKIALPALKLVWFAGEVFPIKQFLYWYDHLQETVFVNQYGPIEITLDCTYYEVRERPLETEPLPIGRPYKNTDILILNEQNQRCTAEEEGELCVRGTSLALGYYRNPQKTSEVFVQNPLNDDYPELIYRTGDMVCMRKDGMILFKGRKDTLIKHMGYRIELGEIEHVVVNELKLVKYCCAVYRSEKKEIVLYYENEKEITEKEFRIALRKVFPAYMIPCVFENMVQLPRNTNGKIDRLFLKNKANMEAGHTTHSKEI